MAVDVGKRKRMVRSSIVVALIFCTLLVMVGPKSVQAATWLNGDVVVGLEDGTYQVYGTDGILKDTLSSGIGGISTGCAFDANGDLYTTSFSGDPHVVAFSGADPHSILQTISTGTSGDEDSESIVFAKNGDFYVGNADGARHIERYNAAGALQQTYNVNTGNRGTDWTELAADQQTIFYTSEDTQIRRYNVATQTQLPNFADIGGSELYALRLLPPGDGSGGLIVAHTDTIQRLNEAGSVVQTYTAPGENFWFALNLDPNGTSFWSADINTGDVYRFNIATGTIELGPIHAGQGVDGLCIKGEATVAIPTVTPTISGTPYGGPSTIGNNPPPQPSPQPGIPYFNSVSTKLGNFFFTTPTLPAIALKNDYTLSIDWNGSDPGMGTSGSITAQVNGHNQTFDGSLTTITLDLHGKLNDGYNSLTLIAMAGGKQSAPYAISLFTLPDWPAWMLILTPGYFDTQFTAENDQLRYTFTGHFPSDQEKACEITFTIPDWVPFVGGTTGIPNPQADIEVEATSRGELSGKLTGKVCFSLAPANKPKVTITGGINGQAEGHFDAQQGLIFDKGTVGLSLDGKIKEGEGLTAFIPPVEEALNAPIIGPPLTWLNDKATIYAQIEPKVSLGAKLVWRNNRLTYDHSEGTFGTGLEVGAELDIVSGLKASVDGGGELETTLQFPANPSYFSGAKATIYGELSAEFGPFEDTFKASHEWSSSSNQASPTRRGVKPLIRTNTTGWHLTPRRYIQAGKPYAQFHPQPHQLVRGVSGVLPKGLTSDTIVSNVYPSAQPAVAIWGSGSAQRSAVVWIQDDPTKPVGLGTDVVSSVFDGTTWSTPVTLTDDLTPDFRPQLAADGSGHLVAVWERVVGATSGDTFDQTYAKKMELASAVYDTATGSWSAPTLLTTNTSLDFEPHLVAGTDGTLLLTSLQNDAGDITSTPASPHRLQATFWNGSAWSTSQTVASQVSEASPALFNSANGSVLFVRDDDGDPTTTTDQHLLSSTWNGSTWSAATETTTTGTLSTPRNFYTKTGTAVLVWKEGSTLVSLRNGVRTVLATEQEPGWLDARVSIDPNDNILLLYQAASAEGVDLYRITYDASASAWGKPTQMTHDRPAEAATAPIFASDGSLWAATLKADLITNTVVFSGTTIPNVTQIGQHDLAVLRHTLDSDLSIASSDVQGPPAFQPGVTTPVTVTVHNQGDLTAQNVVVALQDNGNLVTQGAITTLGSGFTQTLTLAYTPPTDGSLHTLSVIVDPNNLINDDDRSNNHVDLVALAPNLVVSDTAVLYPLGQPVQIQATVANIGDAPAGVSSLRMAHDVITGTTLLTLPVPPLPAHASTIVTGTWDVSGLSTGSYPIALVANSDASVVESNQADNDALTAVGVGPDLAIQSDDLQRIDNNNLQVRVRNEGNRSVSNWDLALIQGNVLTTTGTPLWSRTITQTLQAGEAITLTIQTNSGIPPVYRVWADPNHRLFETATWNNAAGEDGSTGTVTPTATSTVAPTATSTTSPTPTSTRIPESTATATSTSRPPGTRNVYVPLIQR